MTHPSTLTAVATTVALASLLLGACASASDEAAAARPPGTSESTSAAPADPSPGASPDAAAVDAAGSTGAGGLEVVNCERPVSLDAAPERVVTLYPSMTELLVELGVGEQIIGQANTELSPPSDAQADAVAAVPVLSSSVPSKEALLAADPDLIVSDGKYWFDGERLQTMDELEALGIEVYVNSGYCFADVTAGRVDDFLTDLDALGTLFDVQPRAQELIAQTEQRLSELQAARPAEPVATVMLQVFDGQVYALARGMYSSVLETGGGRNLFEDDLPGDAYFGQVSVESVLAKEPDVVLFSYADPAQVDATQAEIEGLLAGTPAVENGRVHGLPEASFSGTLTSIAGAEEIARHLTDS